ncbi:sensor histidine kinase [Pseudoxanthomonas beigongshangi]|jgi:two-component system sensor histidine kinase DesK
MYFPPVSENSLANLHERRSELRGRGTARWFPLLMLIWSIWIFVTPMSNQASFPNWLWPTLASYAVFLVLFHGAYYRDRRYMLFNALGMAALGYALTPFNPGAQSYMIYACAFVAFSGPARHAVTWMLILLAMYSIEWIALGWPLIYLASTLMVGFAVGLMNISFARKAQADAALMLSHEEVRRLAAMAERERIGRDLHDLLGHTLSLVALKSDLAGKLLDRDLVAARREIDEVSRVARDALAQVRSAVTGIRAAGLAAELASARLLLESDGVTMICPAEIPPLSPEQETVLALTVREAVTNLQRHARASTARVELEATADRLRLRIEDNGRGGAIVPGNGLSGMRERLEVLGGSLRIDARPGRGTVLEASLPAGPLAPRAAGAASLLPAQT